jgi:hypothetical protein
VRRGKAGQLGEAAAMLAEAADRLPGNLQIVSNAAFALLLDVFSNGFDAGKLRDASRFEQGVRERQPDHPKLAEIAELRRRMGDRFGQANLAETTP